MNAIIGQFRKVIHLKGSSLLSLLSLSLLKYRNFSIEK